MDLPLSSSGTFSKQMRYAIREATIAYEEGEVPVGAVITSGERIIAKAHNQTETLNDPTAHAEILAITSACTALNNKYLHDCTLYVTLEPCPMCTGAMVWAKLDRVVFGASDTNSGACGTVFNLAQQNKLNHQMSVIQGVREFECEELLKNFFEDKRGQSRGNNGSGRISTDM